MEKEIYLSSDQPVTCPHCGNRTDITAERGIRQFHQCLSPACAFHFIIEEEEEEE